MNNDVHKLIIYNKYFIKNMCYVTYYKLSPTEMSQCQCMILILML